MSDDEIKQTVVVATTLTLGTLILWYLLDVAAAKSGFVDIEPITALIGAALVLATVLIGPRLSGGGGGAHGR